LASIGWIRYEAPIDAGLIEVISTSCDGQEVAIRTMTDRKTRVILKQDDLDVDAITLTEMMEELGYDVKQVMVMRIEDLTKIMKGK
jgi:hypothetical protein